MYIYKNGMSITIGDTVTGNARLGDGHQFIDYTLREAEQLYRQRYGLQRKRFKHKRVSRSFFYVF